jgi:hypothetical protein
MAQLKETVGSAPFDGKAFEVDATLATIGL